MKNNFLGEIRPMTPNGGSLKDKLPSRTKDVHHHEHVHEVREERTERRYTPPPVEPDDVDFDTDQSGKSWGRIGSFIVLGILVLGGAVYGLSFLFRGATVALVPKVIAGTVDLSLTASTSETDPLHYEIMTLPESVSKEVTATHTDTAKMKASGTIIVYNNQSTSQQLVATTRFADPSGKVFRLSKDVTIPKKTATAPGQATVTLVADQAGPEGNIGLSDFTVVAFKGTAKEKLVYGRGKTAFTGGTSGAVFYLTDEEYKTAVEGLPAELNQKLTDGIGKQVPDGYFLLPGSLTFMPDEVTNKNNPSQTAVMNVTYAGTERGVLLKKSDLGQFVLNAIKGDQTVTADDVAINFDDLQYAIATDVSGTALPARISFTVKGEAKAVWNINQQAIQTLLAGTKRNTFSAKQIGRAHV